MIGTIIPFYRYYKQFCSPNFSLENCGSVFIFVTFFHDYFKFNLLLPIYALTMTCKGNGLTSCDEVINDSQFGEPFEGKRDDDLAFCENSFDI